jgi:hypothetical protein
MLSPKSQLQPVALPLEVSLNCTAKGALPPVTLLVKFAPGTSTAPTQPIARIQKNITQNVCKTKYFL